MNTTQTEVTPSSQKPGLTNTSTQGVQPRVTPSSTQNNTPKVPLPPPIMLFITKHYSEQLKTLTMIFPNLRTKTTGEFLKLYTNNHEEYHSLKETIKQLHCQFYVITAKNDRLIKVVIKGLPKSTHIDEIKSDLEEQGFEPERVVQLIGRKTKNPLPVYISLPRNITNLKIFDIKTLGYLSIRVEPYEGRGIAQCFTCNNFNHTSENCYITPRCLKCGKGKTGKAVPATQSPLRALLHIKTKTPSQTSSTVLYDPTLHTRK
ncbi:nucleic-acid-binding protein from transposon X-element [Trichonephila clavipes]|nr:nucleic-acid-binding protein from transposon X-element [Trichonephila clavipes]